MGASQRKRNQLVVPALEQDYRHGFQHVMPTTNVSVKEAHGTMIVCLLNDARLPEMGAYGGQSHTFKCNV